MRESADGKLPALIVDAYRSGEYSPPIRFERRRCVRRPTPLNLQYHRVFDHGVDGKYAVVAAKLAPHSAVLEIGCHSGSFSRYLTSKGHRVLGIESDMLAADTARAFGIDVITGDVQDPKVTGAIDRTFDAVLLMDVLEHLTTPEVVLMRLSRLVAPGGELIITGPNVAYWRVRLGLLLGQWRYEDSGILDRTHLRFYTAGTWRELVLGSGYQIAEFGSAEGMIPLEGRLIRLKMPQRAVDTVRKWAVYLLPALFTTVFFIRATRS